MWSKAQLRHQQHCCGSAHYRTSSSSSSRTHTTCRLPHLRAGVKMGQASKAVMVIGLDIKGTNEWTKGVEAVLAAEGFIGRAFSVTLENPHLIEPKQELLRIPYDLVIIGAAMPVYAPAVATEIAAYVKESVPGTLLYQMGPSDIREVLPSWNPSQGGPPPEAVINTVIVSLSKSKLAT